MLSWAWVISGLGDLLPLGIDETSVDDGGCRYLACRTEERGGALSPQSASPAPVAGRLARSGPSAKSWCARYGFSTQVVRFTMRFTIFPTTRFRTVFFSVLFTKETASE